MTGLTHPDDDLLRRALAAEADGVVAGPDLLARTRDAVARHAVRRRRRLVLLAAAVVVLVVGLVALLDAGRGDDVRIEPAPPVGHGREGATPDTAESQPREPEDQPAAGGYPRLIALVREDGMLVTIDPETGRQRELHSEGDPSQDDGGVARQSIQTVELSPDGRWIYFTRCCEPAVGTIFRIPVEGGPVEEIGPGSYPKVSPDGQYLAFTYGQAVRVSRIGGGAPVVFETGMPAYETVWSPDGTELAVTVRSNDGGAPTVKTFRFDGATLTPSGTLSARTRFALWETEPGNAWTGIGSEMAGDARSMSQDVSYDWVIAVDQDGVVTEQHGFTNGVITPIPDIPRALAADW
jgi:hypothetical protein